MIFLLEFVVSLPHNSMAEHEIADLIMAEYFCRASILLMCLWISANNLRE